MILTITLIHRIESMGVVKLKFSMKKYGTKFAKSSLSHTSSFAIHNCRLGKVIALKFGQDCAPL